MPLTPILEKKLHQLLATIATEQNYVNYDLQIAPLSTGGANYSSTLHKVKIKEDNKTDLNLFVKVAALGDDTRENCDLKGYYAEHYFYTTLKRIFKDLETKYQVPEEGRLVIPTYYGAITTPKEEMLVLEDLGVQGFTTYDRLKSIDWPYASAAITELAKFHALGFACAKEYPKEHHIAAVELKTHWIDERMFKQFWQTNLDRAVAVVKEKNREKLKKFFDRVDLHYARNIFEPLKKPALIHIDFRPSNLMHRNREDGTVEVILVDYQAQCSGCVITDLLNLIFTGTDEEFRRQYFDQLVEHYYSELKAGMTRLGLSDEVYSREDFDYEYKMKLPEGLVMAAFYLPIITVPEENAPNVEAGIELSKLSQITLGTLYPERMNGVVDDYVRWGLI